MPLNESEIKWQRRAILALALFPLAGFVAAVASLWGNGVSALDLTILAVSYVITVGGITIGYHRLLTHRSFKTRPWVRYLFAAAGSMAFEGSVIGWVADHRRHHAYADKEGDPHSPHLEDGDGVGGALKGLWHAHFGWLFKRDATERRRWAPDLLKDPGLVTIDRLFPVFVVASLLLPALIGLVVTRSPAGALSAFLWGGLARVFLVNHVTFSVNSICHFYGKRPFATTDLSTNNWPLALLSFGESWHNNHHAFPSSAIHGLSRWQIDPGAWVIRMLERVGLAWDVKRPPDRKVSAKTA